MTPSTSRGAKVRALLAVLLARRDTPVSADRLREELWDEPPARALVGGEAFDREWAGAVPLRCRRRSAGPCPPGPSP